MEEPFRPHERTIPAAEVTFSEKSRSILEWCPSIEGKWKHRRAGECCRTGRHWSRTCRARARRSTPRSPRRSRTGRSLRPRSPASSTSRAVPHQRSASTCACSARSSPSTSARRPSGSPSSSVGGWPSHRCPSRSSGVWASGSRSRSWPACPSSSYATRASASSGCRWRSPW